MRGNEWPAASSSIPIIVLHLIIKTALCELHVTGDTLLWWLCYILSSVMRVETPEQTTTDKNKSWERQLILKSRKLLASTTLAFYIWWVAARGSFLTLRSRAQCRFWENREQGVRRGGWCLYFTARADAGAENPSVTTQLRVAWAQRGERNVQISWESLLVTASQHRRLIWILHN